MIVVSQTATGPAGGVVGMAVGGIVGAGVAVGGSGGGDGEGVEEGVAVTTGCVNVGAVLTVGEGCAVSIEGGVAFGGGVVGWTPGVLPGGCSSVHPIASSTTIITIRPICLFLIMVSFVGWRIPPCEH